MIYFLFVTAGIILGIEIAIAKNLIFCYKDINESIENLKHEMYNFKDKTDVLLISENSISSGLKDTQNKMNLIYDTLCDIEFDNIMKEKKN